MKKSRAIKSVATTVLAAVFVITATACSPVNPEAMDPSGTPIPTQTEATEPEEHHISVCLVDDDGDVVNETDAADFDCYFENEIFETSQTGEHTVSVTLVDDSGEVVVETRTEEE